MNNRNEGETFPFPGTPRQQPGESLFVPNVGISDWHRHTGRPLRTAIFELRVGLMPVGSESIFGQSKFAVDQVTNRTRCRTMRNAKLRSASIDFDGKWFVGTGFFKELCNMSLVPITIYLKYHCTL